jgi:microcystin-dependent protein
MSEPFLAEIRLMSFGYAPRGWAFCNGQLLPINQNQALFSLLGTSYGGDGRTNFALPDLRGRVPIHTGNGHVLGEKAGATTHTLSSAQMPAHTHTLQASATRGASLAPTGNVLASALAYRAPTALTSLSPESITSVGGSQPHENMQPYLTINFCIALQGIFPSQS